jgi:membrane-associated phospholipid phosphatase
MAQALWDDGHEDATLYAGVLGSRFDLARLPVTAKVLALVVNDEDIAGDMAKAYFKRPRPWSLDPTLKGCPYRPNANPLTSYPSGHATAGYAVGVVLADLVPARAAAILARAQDYAFSRLVCGLHYRSDLAAGEVLGTVVAEDILHDPRMQADLSAARAELAAAGI